MKPWGMLLDNEPPTNAIAPLFWQHGESESVLREEMRKMREGGIGGCIVESRPHPDYLGQRWWHDLDVIVDEARALGMQVWLFDDKDYPSGFAAGLLRDAHPEFLKVYLAEKHIDAVGPLKGSSFFVKPWLDEGDQLVRVIAARQLDRGDALISGTQLDLTARVEDGVLYWDVPAGFWRVFLFYATRRGGEEHTRDYLNPLEPEPVRAYLDMVYEEHYRHLKEYFGNTIAGFFTDEPRFGSMASYKAPLGNKNAVLPFSGRLLAQLDEAWDGDFGLALPFLWYESSEHVDAVKESARARFTYMNLVSRLFSKNFLGQMGDWCRAHGVRLIGHVVEENGAHARLGYGAGHFFRAMEGLDAAGVDVVYHLWPEFTGGTVSWGGMTEWDAEFAYWGMVKMASSAAHIDPKKNGLTVCEAFGAYGWQEGLKLMKWITDHLAVRGVNYMIPHAFSPKQNDPDCPPHMYARGLNPQWKYYHLLSEYTNRVFHLLSGGVHIAPVGVLYHAEAEWAGAYEPFERAVRILAQDQIDCDVLPADALVDPAQLKIEKGYYSLHRETYQALVVPYAERLPQQLVEVMVRLIQNDVPVIFTGDLPVASSTGGDDFAALLAEMRSSPNTAICADDLVEHLRYLGVQDVITAAPEPSLRCLHVLQEGGPVYFFTNESRDRVVSTEVTLREEGVPVGYDALSDRLFRLAFTQGEGAVTVTLEIEPYESLFVLFQRQDAPQWGERLRASRLKRAVDIYGPWQVSAATAPDAPFRPEPKVTSLGNVALPGKLPRFSGTLRYQAALHVAPGDADGPALLDLGEVYEIADVRLNGKALGARICPPYRYEVSGLLREGANELVIDVTNTLAKAWGDQNPYDRSMPQEPSGLVGPVRLLRE